MQLEVLRRVRPLVEEHGLGLVETWRRGGQSSDVVSNELSGSVLRAIEQYPFSTAWSLTIIATMARDLARHGPARETGVMRSRGHAVHNRWMTLGARDAPRAALGFNVQVGAWRWWRRGHTQRALAAMVGLAPEAIESPPSTSPRRAGASRRRSRLGHSSSYGT